MVSPTGNANAPPVPFGAPATPANSNGSWLRNGTGAPGRALRGFDGSYLLKFGATTADLNAGAGPASASVIMPTSVVRRPPAVATPQHWPDQLKIENEQYAMNGTSSSFSPHSDPGLAVAIAPLATSPFTIPLLDKCTMKFEEPPITCYNELVTVIVGKEEQIFTVHKGLLQWYSTYFAKELVEDDKRILELPQVEPTTLKAFYCFLYTRRLQDKKDIPQYNAEILTKLYIFSHQYGIPRMMNEAIDQLHEWVSTNWTFPSYQLKYIYSNTNDASAPLRRYMVELQHTRSDAGHYEGESQDTYPAAFLSELLIEMHKFGVLKRVCTRQMWAKQSTCKWHDHSLPENPDATA